MTNKYIEKNADRYLVDKKQKYRKLENEIRIGLTPIKKIRMIILIKVRLV